MAMNGYSDEYQDPAASPWLDPAWAASMTPSPDPAPTSQPGGGSFQEAMPGVEPQAAVAPAAVDPSQQSPWLPNPSTPAPASGTQAGAAAPPTWQTDTNGGQAAGTDPRAVARDQMATQVQQDLEADGHKVTWDAQGRMVVDGRKYEVADPNAYDETGASSGQPDMSNGSPADPNAGAPNMPAPGNDENQIEGWASQWLGHTFTQAQLDALKGQPLALVMHDIANSEEAKLYAARKGHRDTVPAGATGAGAAAPAAGGYSVPNIDVPPWLQDAPTYQPSGYLDTELADLPNFRELYDRASAPTPHEAELDALVSNLLQHPESLSEQDVASLKAKAAENAAVAADAQDEELQHYGFNAGLNDSPWLAGQRASNAWNRRNTTVQADQNVDIAAADRRGADKRSAATLGTQYAGYQSGRKQAAISLALDGALAKFGEQRNRTALNASMDQAAAASGLSKAQLIANYVLGATGEAIDVQKLNQQGSQFMQDLAFRVSQLKQQSDQFDAQMQLALQEFQHSKDNDAWAQAQKAYA